MKPIDVMGSVYSSGGLRFGGFQTTEFFLVTNEMERIRPGVREEIVGEAHELAFWNHRLADLVFLLYTWWTRSVGVGLILAGGVYVLELIRFFLYGSAFYFPGRLSKGLAIASWAWGRLRIPAYLFTCLVFWYESKLLAVSVGVFFLLQSFSVVTGILFMPLRLAVQHWRYKGTSENLSAANLEGLALAWTIKRWEQKLGLARR